MNVNYVYGIIFLFLTSCLSPTDRVIPSLLRADSLIEVGCADSALSLLERMNLAELSSIQSRASYALLLTQAKDQNYVTHTDDSLIRVAVDYYDTSDDITLRAKAHYYLGRVCQDRGDIEGTVREFLVAMPLAEKAENYDLNILLKSNLGLLFWRHGLQEEADSLYRQAVELAEAHHDSLRLAVVLVHCADICMERGEEYYTDAEKYLKRALKLVKDTDKQHTEELVFSSLSYLLEYQGKSREAILYANKGMRLVLDSSERYGYYLVIGSAYLQLEQYDSAFVYLNRGIPSDNYYAKTNAYMKLSEMAMRLGKQNEALEYETLYTIYKDSTFLSPALSIFFHIWSKAADSRYLTEIHCLLFFLIRCIPVTNGICPHKGKYKPRRLSLIHIFHKHDIFLHLHYVILSPVLLVQSSQTDGYGYIPDLCDKQFPSLPHKPYPPLLPFLLRQYCQILFRFFLSTHVPWYGKCFLFFLPEIS